ncbi:hypothetical protein NL341_26985, partial [Klebsiella pneumoniae]|nr:hypothetical protein [Klebsiella pneumoniae]
NMELSEREQRKGALYFLPLMWQGISKFVSMNPHYTKLIGPVSMANSFSDESKAIMIRFLLKQRGSDMSSLVSARNPFKPNTPVLKETQ